MATKTNPIGKITYSKSTVDGTKLSVLKDPSHFSKRDLTVNAEIEVYNNTTEVIEFKVRGLSLKHFKKGPDSKTGKFSVPTKAGKHPGCTTLVLKRHFLECIPNSNPPQWRPETLTWDQIEPNPSSQAGPYRAMEYHTDGDIEC